MKRRELSGSNLQPPDYIISPQVLVETHVEIEVKFAGIVPGISVDIDATNRTDLLKIIDKGKKRKIIKTHLTSEDDSILQLNAYKVKLVQRDDEVIIFQVPIHEVAAVCYINEDHEHLLVVKFGDEESIEKCLLCVLYVTDKAQADLVCAVMSQCFQLVYVEAIMHFFDAQLREVTGCGSQGDISSPDRRSEGRFGHQISFLSGSQPNLDTSSYSGLSLGMSRKMSTARSESELSASDLIHDYFWMLHTKLNSGELKQFAQLLTRWHSDLPFSEFCQKVLELFGPHRKDLISGLRPFIPEKDLDYFESFLTQMGIPGFDSASESRKSYRRANSDVCSVGGELVVGGGQQLDEHDHMLQTISSQITSLAIDTDNST